MITLVRYERLYNLGNYENEKLCVEVTVTEATPQAVTVAWAMAIGEVEDQHARLVAEREEAERKRREEYEAEMQRQRIARRKPPTDLPF